MYANVGAKCDRDTYCLCWGFEPGSFGTPVQHSTDRAKWLPPWAGLVGM